MAKDLSTEEKTKIFDQFTSLDKNRDAYVTFDEVHDVLRDTLGFDTEQSRRMFQLCDENDDGKLRFREFVSFYQIFSLKVTEVQGMFTKLDANGNGYVGLEDARAGLGQIGFSRELTDSLIRIYDVNHDGKLQYDEFLRLWNAL